MSICPPVDVDLVMTVCLAEAPGVEQDCDETEVGLLVVGVFFE